MAGTRVSYICFATLSNKMWHGSQLLFTLLHYVSMYHAVSYWHGTRPVCFYGYVTLRNEVWQWQGLFTLFRNIMKQNVTGIQSVSYIVTWQGLKVLVTLRYTVSCGPILTWARANLCQWLRYETKYDRVTLFQNVMKQNVTGTQGVSYIVTLRYTVSWRLILTRERAS